MFFCKEKEVCVIVYTNLQFMLEYLCYNRELRSVEGWKGSQRLRRDQKL